MTPAPASAQTQDLKRRRILDAARAQLVKRGYQDLALDDVARAAKVAKGTLFLYFKSKDELFSSAFADLVDQLGEELDAVARSGKRGRPLLESAVAVIQGHFDANKDFLAQFGTGRFPGCGDKSCGRLMERFRANAERVRGILELCAADGVVAKGDLGFKAMALFGVCRTSTFYRSLSGAEAAFSERVREVVEFYLNGARPR